MHGNLKTGDMCEVLSGCTEPFMWDKLNSVSGTRAVCRLRLNDVAIVIGLACENGCWGNRNFALVLSNNTVGWVLADMLVRMSK